MGYTTHTVTVYLSIRDDDAPLSDLDVVEMVRALVNAAVYQWYLSDPEAQESLVDTPDVEGSIERALDDTE